MPIYKTEKVSINGSQFFLGGVVYSMNFNKGFNGQPSTVEASIVSASQNYQIPDLSFTTPYNIKIGGNGSDIPVSYNLNFFAYKYCLTDGEGGKILSVSFQDNINKLRRKWITPFGEVCSNPNVIQIGSALSSQGTRNKIISYSYREFQIATAFLGIPNIHQNEFVRLNDQGTVLDIFNRFMEIYGYTWYLDGDTIVLIDVKVPVDITGTISILESNTRKLNSTICTDISNNYIRGAVAMDELGQNDAGSFILTAANCIWDGDEFSDASILDVPIVAGYGPKAALYAMQSPEIYFAYIWHKVSLNAAIEAFGYHIWTDGPMSDSQVADILEKQTTGDVPVYSSTQAQNIHLFVVSQNKNQSDWAYTKDRMLGEILAQGYYLIKDINPSVQWREGQPVFLDPNCKIVEIPQFKGLLSDPDLKNVGSHTTQFCWLLSFPKQLIFDFDDYTYQLASRAFLKQLNLPISSSVGTFADDSYIYLQVDTSQEEVIVYEGLPDIPYGQTAKANPSILEGGTIAQSLASNNGIISSTRYVVGNLDTSRDIRFSVPTYGLSGRKIAGCLIPSLTDETANIEIVRFENLTLNVVNPTTFLQQQVFSRNQVDVEYNCEIRGIHAGTIITPEMGFDSVSIRLDGQEGYVSSYKLTSKRAKPPTEQSFTKQKVTIN